MTFNTNDLKSKNIFKKTFINGFRYFFHRFTAICVTFCGKLFLFTNGDNGVIIGHTLGLIVIALRLQYLQRLSRQVLH